MTCGNVFCTETTGKDSAPVFIMSKIYEITIQKILQEGVRHSIKLMAQAGLSATHTTTRPISSHPLTRPIYHSTSRHSHSPRFQHSGCNPVPDPSRRPPSSSIGFFKPDPPSSSSTTCLVYTEPSLDQERQGMVGASNHGAISSSSSRPNPSYSFYDAHGRA